MEWGIEISVGQIDALLSAGKTSFHSEKEALLTAGLEVSCAITVDDSGARHQGKNGYVTQIGNELFARFAGTGSKNRINFLECLHAGASPGRISRHIPMAVKPTSAITSRSAKSVVVPAATRAVNAAKPLPV
jgi:hypothetical protein